MLKYKEFTAEEAKVDAEERTITAVISTGAVDRDHEVVLPSGMNAESYMKNPVVLWAHNYYDTPIGKTLWVTKGRNKITARFKLADTEKAEEVYQLYKGGFLNAFSIGFRPLEVSRPTPDEIKKKPEWAEASRVFKKWELLEFSPVPVPANPEALSVAVKSQEVTLSDETLKDLQLVEDEIEETLYSNQAVDSESENETHTWTGTTGGVDNGTATINDIEINLPYSPEAEEVSSQPEAKPEPPEVTNGLTVIDVERIFEPILDVKELPIEVEPIIDFQPFRNRSAEKRKSKGIMYDV